MGYMRHHALIVTSENKELIAKAFEHVATLGDTRMTSIYKSGTNGYWTFMLLPDGSKSSWHEDTHGDSCRERFKEWLKAQRYEDGSSSLAWVEVMYGDDNLACQVVDDEHRDRREKRDSNAATWREG